MVQQLSFQLPEIDREATRKAVEGILEQTRLYKQIGFIRRGMKSTPSYEPRLHAQTNYVGKQAEDVAIWNVDTEKRMTETIEKVDRAVNRLSKREKKIIQMRYFEDEDVYDYTVYNELGYSERQYYRIKSRVFYKIAFMLKIEIYKDISSA